MNLTYKKGKGDKIHISVDGEYFITVDEMYFSSLYLKNGQNIDSDELLQLKSDIDARRAFNYAVSLLSKRAHSEHEILIKFRQKGITEGIEQAIEKLKRFGYIDDERFASLYVSELINIKKYGKRRIEQELYRKGIDRDIIKDVIEHAEFPEERLHELIRRKYIRYLNDEKGVSKTVNALVRLGYSYSEIREALSEINDELNLEVSDE